MACSEEALEDLFGVKRQRLNYWKTLGLIPVFKSKGAHGYPFEVVLAVKVISELKSQGIQPGVLAEAVRKTRRLFPEIINPLIQKTFFAMGGRICILLDGRAYEPLTEQFHLFSLEQYENEVRGIIQDKCRGIDHPSHETNVQQIRREVAFRK